MNRNSVSESHSGEYSTAASCVRNTNTGRPFRGALQLCLLVTLAVGLFNNANAQTLTTEGVNGRNVIVAHHNSGRFENTSSGAWTEFGSNGVANFSFRETHRDDWSVYMFDSSRNVSIQVDIHRKKIRYGVGGAEKTDLYDITRAYRRSAAPAPPTARLSCYWMESRPPYNWIQQSRLSYEQCYEMDSCSGGLGRSGGGCYKGAQGATCPRNVWPQAENRPPPPPPTPAAPTLVFPGQNAMLPNAGGGNWTFSWNPVAGASHYQVQVWGPDAQNPAVDTETRQTSLVHSLRSGSYVADHKRNGWTWRVRANNGRWGPWSSNGGFNVASRQAAPVLDYDQECYAQVQGKIAWDYKGNTRWAQSNLKKLCDGTKNAYQPGACFRRVMHSGINWGGGTQWQWENALNLCRRSVNADRTIACFQNNINAGRQWSAAIAACNNNP